MTPIPPLHSPVYYAIHRYPFLMYEPRLIIITESPPISGGYFYDQSGKTTEPLFSALMESVLRIPRPATKTEGLLAFKDAGCLLLHETDTPIDRLPKSDRKNALNGDLIELYTHLAKVDPEMIAPILLVRKTWNVSWFIGNSLEFRGHHLLNKGMAVEFSSNRSRQSSQKFRDTVTAILDGIQWKPR